MFLFNDGAILFRFFFPPETTAMKSAAKTTTTKRHCAFAIGTCFLLSLLTIRGAMAYSSSMIGELRGNSVDLELERTAINLKFA